MHSKATTYPWAEELEKTVVNSLATSFGLDFLLFQDKKGGEVDTVHNVRQGVWATNDEKDRYDSREKYDREKLGFNKHKNFKEKGEYDKRIQQSGGLKDSYTGNIIINKNHERHLDHVISAKEIYNDPGRILAGTCSVELASHKNNLKPTQKTVNTSKNDISVESYLSVLPDRIKNKEMDLAQEQHRLASMQNSTPQEQHEFRKKEGEIRKKKETIEHLKSIDPDEMRKADKAARQPYNQQINREYYTSSRFLKSTAKSSGVAGLKMGVRQMLGLVLAEVWFELREQLPSILEKMKDGFHLGKFLDSVQESLQGIWKRVQSRFRDFLISFKDGVFAGVMASVSTTLFNVFATTQRMAVKIIRETWGQLVKAIKVMVFNPEKLDFVDVCKSVVSILSVGASVIVGTIIYTQLLPLFSFPFGSELAAFASALVTGVVTLGLNYLLLYSEMARKVWDYIESIMPHAGTVKKYQEINAELDRYLLEMSRFEFNLNPVELEEFSQKLSAFNDEVMRSLFLREEISKMEIELPYEIGNSESTRKWLSSRLK